MTMEHKLSRIKDIKRRGIKATMELRRALEHELPSGLRVTWHDGKNERRGIVQCALNFTEIRVFDTQHERYESVEARRITSTDGKVENPRRFFLHKSRLTS